MRIYKTTGYAIFGKYLWAIGNYQKALPILQTAYTRSKNETFIIQNYNTLQAKYNYKEIDLYTLYKKECATSNTAMLSYGYTHPEYLLSKQCTELSMCLSRANSTGCLAHYIDPRLYDMYGEMYAVFTADISLEWFAEKVNEIKLYPNSFNYMIGRGGTFLVSDRKEAILNESFFARPLLEGDERMLDIGHRMINGENGMSTFERDGEEYYLFFAPVTSTGWSVSVACLYSDIFASVDGMRNMMIALSFVGLLLLAWVSPFSLFCTSTFKRICAVSV